MIFCQKVEVFLNPRDCIKCRVNSEQIFSDYHKDSIDVFVPIEYLEDELILKSKFNVPHDIKFTGIENFDNPNSFYRIHYNGILVDSSALPLYKKAISHLCFESNYLTYSTYEVSANSMIIKDVGLSRFLEYYNNLEMKFLLDSINVLESNYKNFFSDRYFDQLEILNYYNKITNIFDAQLKDVKRYNDFLYFTSSTPIFIPVNNSSDTVVNRYTFLNKLNKNREIIQSYYVPNSDSFNQMGYFGINEDTFYFLVNPSKDFFNTQFPLVVKYIFKNDSFYFDKMLDIKLPESYKQNGLYTNFLTPIFYKNYLIFSYGNIVYNLSNNIQFDLLLSIEEIESNINLIDKYKNIENVSFYRNLDIKIEDEYLLILYYDKNNNLKQKKINTLNGLVEADILLKENLSYKNMHLLPKYYYNKVIYKLKNEKCFREFSI